MEKILVNFPPKILLCGKFTRDRGCPKIGVQTTYLLPYQGCLNVHEKNMEKMFPTKNSIFRIPPPPGGTAILPEYIHYYG
jgi:hypothetical protein